MHARFREEYEVPVVSNEVLETQLVHLREGLDEVRANQTALRTKMDQEFKETHARIDEVETKLTARIDAVDEKLTARIDAVEEKLTQEIKAVDTKLSGKIEALGTLFGEKLDAFRKELLERFDKQDQRIVALDKAQERITTAMKVVLAILGLAATAAVVLNTLRNFHVI